MKLYNTLTNKKEVFRPVEPGKVKIYNCGVTVYDRIHLGNVSGAIYFDVMRNLLNTVGYDVTYVKNYTDIDDKMIKRANERGITVAELAEENIRFHDEDMKSLIINPPDIAPRATDYIPQMVTMIQRLVDKGFTYEVGGSVFFRVRKFPDYGKLSGQNIDELKSGSRVEVDETKEDALDFALWKAAKPNEPTWDSPWGPGRPGWHIECSVMSMEYLGENFDIHVGGSDLIFPHHENEIAQSESANGRKYVNYWLHTGMIKIQGQKMSKSLGNFATVADLVQIYHPELIRFFILSTQYRQPLDFSAEALARSAEGLDRIYGALERYESNKGDIETPSSDVKRIETFRQRFLEAMCDDLNGPLAMAVLFDMTKLLNSMSPDDPQSGSIYDCLLELGGILGILQMPAIQWFKTPRIKKETSDLSDEEIEHLIEKRNQARQNKDWGLADTIRDQLKEASIQLEDRDGKTFWIRK
ncbi:MAG: cysteine--tRNA ligase [Proteobacteria bacterium]|nr:cysteine--tRNA ligase [Pseudomonadota bacterium]